MTNLAGKDYLTIKEAAAYCCVSESQFTRKIGETGLRPGTMWGKKVYRRSDLQKLIEETAWQQSSGEPTDANQGTSPRQPILIGAREVGSVARA